MFSKPTLTFEFLSQIIDEKTGEVELKSDDGPTVNESLVRLLTPAWMKEFKKSKNLSSIPRSKFY